MAPPERGDAGTEPWAVAAAAPGASAADVAAGAGAAAGAWPGGMGWVLCHWECARVRMDPRSNLR